MPIKYKLKKNDPVVVISGKNKNTVSKILELDKEKGQVVVENVNVVKRHTRPNQTNPDGGVVKRHTRPNQTNPDGGIIEKNMPFSISNVMYHCPKCNKGVRLGVKVLENGKKVRYCKKCNEVIDKA